MSIYSYEAFTASTSMDTSIGARIIAAQNIKTLLFSFSSRKNSYLLPPLLPRTLPSLLWFTFFSVITGSAAHLCIATLGLLPGQEACRPFVITRCWSLTWQSYRWPPTLSCSFVLFFPPNKLFLLRWKWLLFKVAFIQTAFARERLLVCM